MEGVLLLLTVFSYVLGAFAWPTWRVWRREGVWPVVFEREGAPAQRVLGLLTRALLFAIVATSVARLALGPSAIGLLGVPPAVRSVGWLMLLGGFLSTVVAQRQMGASWRVGIDDRPTALVTAGPFRVVRNPIFSGLLLFLGGYGCLMPAWWSAGLWVATAVGLRIQIAYEERHLLALHGGAYRDYASRVGRLLPFVGRLRPLVGPDAGGCDEAE